MSVNYELMKATTRIEELETKLEEAQRRGDYMSGFAETYMKECQKAEAKLDRVWTALENLKSVYELICRQNGWDAAHYVQYVDAVKLLAEPREVRV